MRNSALSPTRERVSCAMRVAAAVRPAKLVITPLGVPVEPDVYSSMARSSAARVGWPASAGVRATMASQVSKAVGGASGRAMQGRASGTPADCCGQVSSLPTNNALAPLCCST